MAWTETKGRFFSPSHLQKDMFRVRMTHADGHQTMSDSFSAMEHVGALKVDHFSADLEESATCTLGQHKLLHS